MQIEISGDIPHHPKPLTTALAGVAEALCRATDKDPAEAVTLLITAAVKIFDQYDTEGSDLNGRIEVMAQALGAAVLAAEQRFPRKATPKPANAP